MLSSKLRKSIAATPDSGADAKLEEPESPRAYVSPVQAVKRPAVTSMVMKQASQELCTLLKSLSFF